MSIAPVVGGIAKLSGKPKRRVLVIEDDRSIRHAVCRAFVKADYDVSETGNGSVANHMLATHSYDLIVLDLMLPGATGLEILQQLRDSKSTPVIVVTAQAALEDRVSGFELGADDYLVKPFELAELMARAQAIARRVEGTITNRMLVGGLIIDRAARSVIMNDDSIFFSDTEFDILVILACDYGKVVPRENLEKVIRTIDSDNIQNLLDAYILRLRKKLGKDAIINRRSEGFLLNV